MNESTMRSMYDLYANDVYRFSKLMLGDEEEAKDVTQEVFYRAFKGWGAFREEAKVKTWIMSIARNYTFDLLRKKRTQQKLLTQYRLEHEENQKDYHEEMRLVEEAILKLKDSYRQVFLLRHVQNYSVQETAEILSWSASKVTTTDQRAIKKLQIIMEGDLLNEQRRSSP